MGNINYVIVAQRGHTLGSWNLFTGKTDFVIPPNFPARELATNFLKKLQDLGAISSWRDYRIEEVHDMK